MPLRYARAALLLPLFAVGLAAQEPPDPGARNDRQPNRLFRDERPLEMVLTSDFKQLFKDRDTTKEERIAGRLRYRAPEGEEGEMAVDLATRGHSRLIPVVCDFPPLRLYLPDRENRPRLWRGQGSLKLTVNCRPRDREYEQYVLEEYLLYRGYTLFTDLSFRVRLARTVYLEEASGDTVAATWAFLVEDPDDMAARNGGEDLEEPGVRFRDIETRTMALMSVYEYMVGNTDWALPLLHNVRVVKIPPGLYHTVPYDFDFSGLIRTRYARPSPRLPIRSVRDRLYRGPCLPMEDLQPVLALFVERKEALYALFRSQEGLDPKRLESHLKYLEEFYRTITDQGKARGEFRYACG